MFRFSYTACRDRRTFSDRLDVKAFAKAGGHPSGHDTLLKYRSARPKRARGLHPDLRVDWMADGELHHPWHGRPGLAAPEGQRQPALICQRCLHPVDVPLEVERGSVSWPTRPRPRLWTARVKKTCWC